MNNVLIAYGTWTGTTRTVAKAIGAWARNLRSKLLKVQAA